MKPGATSTLKVPQSSDTVSDVWLPNYLTHVSTTLDFSPNFCQPSLTNFQYLGPTFDLELIANFSSLPEPFSLLEIWHTYGR